MKKYICLFILLVLSISSIAFSSDDFKEKAQEIENKYSFRQLKRHEGGISQIYTLLTMCENFKLIQSVQKGEIKYPKLKNILHHFDNVIRKKGKTKKSFIELYEYLNDRIPEGEVTHGSMDIIEVLENGGDCNDVSPVFYSLFKYYGFNMYVIIGSSHNIKENTDVLHAWLGVEFEEDKIIELDPLWYGPYYELNRRKGRYFDLFDVKDKYVIKRKFK